LRLLRDDLAADALGNPQRGKTAKATIAPKNELISRRLRISAKK